MSQIQTRNPATGEVLETYEVMGEQEVFAKIDSAHEAFLDWRSKSHEERAPYLRKIAGVLRNNSERFSELMTREMGKLLRDGKTEVELCARLFEYAADKGPEELADPDWARLTQSDYTQLRRVFFTEFYADLQPADDGTEANRALLSSKPTCALDVAVLPCGEVAVGLEGDDLAPAALDAAGELAGGPPL